MNKLTEQINQVSGLLKSVIQFIVFCIRYCFY